MTTLHIFLDLPPLQALRAHLLSGDRCMHLNLFDSDEGVRRALDEQGVDVLWIAHDMVSQEAFDGARAALLEQLAALPRRPLTGEKSLLDVLTHEDTFGRMSLWWWTPMSERHLRAHLFLQHLMRLWWMKEGGGDAQIEAVMSESLCVWSKDARMARQLISHIEGDHSVQPLQVSARHSETGRLCDPRQDELDLDSMRRWRRRSKGAWRAIKVWRALRRVSPDVQEISRADVLIVTYGVDWVHHDDHSATHRYMQEIAEALGDDEVRAAWLPVATLPSSPKLLSDGMSAQSTLPMLAGALDAPDALLPALFGALFDTWRRSRGVLKLLVGHPALMIFGVDISPWLCAELAQLLDEDLIKHLWLRHRVGHAMARSGARLLFYRNEFHVLGRAIASVKTPGAHKWGFQHGIVIEDYLTYQYKASDFHEPHALPSPDRLFTYGEHTIDLITRTSGPSSAWKAIGSPRHDAIFRRASQKKSVKATRERLSLPTDRPVCLLCGQLIDSYPAWIDRLVKGLRAAKIDAHIAIKQHHYHRAEPLIAALFEELSWSDYSLFVDDLEPLLVASDVMLSGYSTTGFEALIYGTPFICFDEADRYVPFPFVTDGAAYSGQDVDAVQRALEDILRGFDVEEFEAQRERFLRHHFGDRAHLATTLLLEEVRAHFS